MRIAVVAHNLRSAGGLSVGRNIVALLPDIAPSHEYLFLVPAAAGYDRHSHREHVEVVEVSAPDSMIIGPFASLFDVRARVRRFGPDLVWSLGNLPLRGTGAQQALLVHDPHLFYSSRSFATELARNRMRKRLVAWYLRRSLKFVDVVFCQTRTAASRFAARYEHPRVAVMANAISSLVEIGSTAGESGRRTKGSGEPFTLFALTKYYPHKNLELIVDAYVQHRDLMHDTLCLLTIDPAQHPGAEALLHRISAEVPDQIVNLGPLSQETLATYYRKVDALVQPTTLESFSAAYLEAMAFGVPIVTSDLDFAREICGEAALYVDPSDPLEFARCIVRLRDGDGLRERLVSEGRRQLAAASAGWPDILCSALDELRVEHG
jgi:glycosyltransferase involved in cell wall biosynthesis